MVFVRGYRGLVISLRRLYKAAGSAYKLLFLLCRVL